MHIMALVQSGIVAAMAIWDGVSTWSPPGYTLVDVTSITCTDGSPVRIGATYSGSAFTAPLPVVTVPGLVSSVNNITGPVSLAAAAPLAVATVDNTIILSKNNLNPNSSTSVIEYLDDMHLYSNASAVGALDMFYTSSGSASFARVSPTNANQVGILGFHSGFVNTGSAIASSSIVDCLLGGAAFTYAVYGQLAGVGVPTSTNNYLVKLGMINTFPGAQHGVYFTVDRSLSTTNFISVTVQGSTVTSMDTGVAMDTNWHNFRFEINAAGTSVGFFIDGNLVTTHTTNIPVTNGQQIGPMIQIQCNSASMAVEGVINVDFLYFKYQPGTNRGTY